MKPSEIRKKIEDKLGRPMKANLGMEYDHVIGVQLRPGEKLCFVKDTGEVMWEEDLPEEYAPRGKGTVYILMNPED